MRPLFSILILFSALNNCISQDELRFVFDNKGTTTASGENIYSTYQFINHVEDHLFENWFIRMDSLHKDGNLLIAKTLKFLLIDLPVTGAGFVYQHERGHAFRGKAANYLTDIKLDYPFPYGRGSGQTGFGGLSDNLVVGSSEKIAIRSAGIEASAAMAGSIRSNWIKNGYINKSESLLYLLAFHDPTLYIISADSEEVSINNDIRQYLSSLHSRHGITNRDLYRIDESGLKTRAVLNLLNPLQFFALNALFISPKKLNLIGIKLGQHLWLPSFRFNLNPFGPEYILENVFYNEKHIIDTNIRIGEATFEKNYGLGIYYYRNISQNLSLNFKSDVWYQPSMELGGTQQFDTKKGIGGRIIAELNYRDYNSLPIGVFCQVGYKTDGHIQGELLDKQAIFRIGLSLDSSDIQGKSHIR